MKTSMITFKYGIFIYILLSIYFLAIEGGGLADVLPLKLINLLIVGIGVSLHIQEKVEKGNFNYINLLSFGMRSAIIGVFLAILSLYIYLTFYKEPNYFKTLSSSLLVASNEIEYCFALFIEGISSSIIIVFIVMQYNKNRASNSISSVD